MEFPRTEADTHGTDPRIDLVGGGPPDPGKLGAVADPAPLGAASPYAAVAAAVGTSDDTVARWHNRYLEAGLERLADRLHSGRPPTYTDVDREAMWKKLRDDPPDGHTGWSLSLLAQATGISTTQLLRWWSDAGS